MNFLMKICAQTFPPTGEIFLNFQCQWLTLPGQCIEYPQAQKVKKGGI